MIHAPVLSRGKDTEVTGCQDFVLGSVVVEKTGLGSSFAVGERVWTCKSDNTLIEYRGLIKSKTADTITVTHPAIAGATSPKVWDSANVVAFESVPNVPGETFDGGRTVRWSEGGTPHITKRQAARRWFDMHFENAPASERKLLREFIAAHGLYECTLSFYNFETEQQEVHGVVVITDFLGVGNVMPGVMNFDLRCFLNTPDTYK